MTKVQYEVLMSNSKNIDAGGEAQHYVLRRATPDDFRAVQIVETRAAERYSTVGLGFIAEAPPLPIERLAKFCNAGGLHVLAAGDDIVGMAAHAIVDGEGYLAELDVLPEHAGKRLGLRLLEAVETCLLACGIKGLWLITYRDISWNGPYYTKAGFVEQAPRPSSQLSQRLSAEKAGPLGVRPRIAMRKVLP